MTTNHCIKLALSLLLLPSLTWSAGESCNALLNLGLYNVNQSSSASDAQAMSLSTFCSADYSNSSISESQAAAIKAAYGLFGGGASASVSRQEIMTKQSQLCKGDFDSSHYTANASDYSKTVYQGTLDAWNKCQALANKGLVFDIQPSSTLQGVSVSLTAPTGLSAMFYGVTQYGTGQSSCTTLANGKVLNVSTSKPFKFTAASKVTINCARQMQVNGQDLTADAQDLVFVTSADNLTVPLAAIGSFSRMTADQIKAAVINEIQPDGLHQQIDTVGQKVDTLVRQIDTLNQQFTNQSNQITSLRTATEWVIAVNCPTGWSDMGMTGIVAASGTAPAQAKGFGFQLYSGIGFLTGRLCYRSAQ